MVAVRHKHSLKRKTCPDAVPSFNFRAHTRNVRMGLCRPSYTDPGPFPWWSAHLGHCMLMCPFWPHTLSRQEHRAEGGCHFAESAQPQLGSVPWVHGLTLASLALGLLLRSPCDRVVANISILHGSSNQFSLQPYLQGFLKGIRMGQLHLDWTAAAMWG